MNCESQIGMEVVKRVGSTSAYEQAIMKSRASVLCILRRDL